MYDDIIMTLHCTVIKNKLFLVYQYIDNRSILFPNGFNSAIIKLIFHVVSGPGGPICPGPNHWTKEGATEGTGPGPWTLTR